MSQNNGITIIIRIGKKPLCFLVSSHKAIPTRESHWVGSVMGDWEPHALDSTMRSEFGTIGLYEILGFCLFLKAQYHWEESHFKILTDNPLLGRERETKTVR